MRKSTFLKHLNQLGEEELREELGRLYTQLDEVKKYYSMELGSEAERKKIYDAVKKNITAKYATRSYRRPKKPRIAIINRILKEADKKAIFRHELIDLYLFDLETAATFMLEYRFYSETLHNHMIKVSKKCKVLLDHFELFSDYEHRIESALLNIPYDSVEEDIASIFQ